MLGLADEVVARSKDKYYLVFELVPGGELFHRIVKLHHFNEHDAATCVKGILDGVAYLHHRGICHRDLKPENLLFRSTDPSRLDDIVIADFGVARHLDSTALTRTLVGSPGYTAPELFNEDGYKGQPADMWSVGVITYALLSGTTPFKGDHMDSILKEQMTGHIDFSRKIWTGISQDAKEFIMQCCATSPKKRLTVDEALSHPWLDKESGRSSHDIGGHVRQTLYGLQFIYIYKGKS